MDARWDIREEHHRDDVARGERLDRLEHCPEYWWWTQLAEQLCRFADNNQQYCQRILQTADVLRSRTLFKVANISLHSIPRSWHWRLNARAMWILASTCFVAFDERINLLIALSLRIFQTDTFHLTAWGLAQLWRMLRESRTSRSPRPMAASR